ncbi:FAD-dependent oxidoreductase [Devosia honganensis]|uniref:FAD-dependent oxidoreductase n=1 Tax=Devosia honganensis TaxID=1610527 RepID=A0ABV7X0Y7_9HYPH
MTEKKHLVEPARKTPVRYEVDVLVVGGGSAGLIAAVAASRQGASVLLVEQNGFLGGTLTMTTVGSICGLYTVDDEEVTPIIGGIGAELMARLAQAGGARGPERWLKTASMLYDPVLLRLFADDLAAEAGVEVVLHSTAVGSVIEGERLNGVIFESGSGRWAALAKVVVDTTGDGDIMALSGAAFEYDRDEIQASTAMFQLGGVDTERAMRIGREDLHGYLEQAVAAGVELPRTAGGMFSLHPGFAHMNITRVRGKDAVLDPLDAAGISAIEVEGRRQIQLYHDAFRRFVPGFESSFVAAIGSHIGLRESRRLSGVYRLELEDVLGAARFDDVIACGAWPVEDHAGGRSTRWVFLEPGTYYHLPYRMLLPQTVDGLLVAGRCASASHDAHASMRVAGICFALGEAAGVAAAQAAAGGIAPRAVDVRRLQRQLIAQGAFLGDPGGVG